MKNIMIKNNDNLYVIIMSIKMPEDYTNINNERKK